MSIYFQNFECLKLKLKIFALFKTLPDWEAAQAGTFAIKFRTSEPHGLLVFSKAQGTSFVRSDSTGCCKNFTRHHNILYS